MTKMQRRIEAERRIASFRLKARGLVQHNVNTLHIYCRLCDLGLSKRLARRICEWLEPALKLAYL